METEEYRQFTSELTERLQADARVLGMVAAGSMAHRDYLPDEWSDHDFFVITESGHQESFRTNLSWLPRHDEIVFSYRETAHGLKALYRDGHLLEFAVFDSEELRLARVNRYRVLFDKGNIEQTMNEVAEATIAATPPSSDDLWNFGQFLTNILVGVGRHRRGECLNGAWFVKTNALRHLVSLIRKHVPSPRKEILDNLDELRRLEFAYPELGVLLNEAIGKETPDAGKALIAVAVTTLKTRLHDYPHAAVSVVLKKITE